MKARQLLWVLLCLPGLGWGQCERPLSIGWEPWAPFMHLDAQGRLTGLDVELAQALGEEMGCALHFVELPFKRHMVELEAGRIDLASSVQWTAERERFAYFSSAYRQAEVRLIVRQGESAALPLSSLQELARLPLRLGLTRGYFYGEAFAALQRDPGALQLEDAISDRVNLDRLLAWRIDGLLADPLVIAALAAPGKVEVHPLPIHSSRFHFIASRRSVSEAQMHQLDRALQRLRERGELQRILSRYQLD